MTLKAIVVDDSAFNRKVIGEILEAIPGVTVVARAFDGRDAIRKILQHKPDFITLDLEMPEMDGFALLRWLMVNRPLPVLVVSSRESNRSVFKALDLGAVDFIVKPSRRASPQLKEIAEELRSKVLGLSEMNFENIRRRVEEAPPMPPEIPRRRPRAGTSTVTADRVLAMVASTGGPPALQTILSELPADWDVPVLVAQHMPPIFTRMFADRLDSMCKIQVVEASDALGLRPGTVYIAPGDGHLQLTPKCRLRVDREGDYRYRPSADALLSSVARACGSGSLGVVLTGMGDDGADGADELARSGGKIIVESKETAVIYGMPKEVEQRGIPCRTLPLNRISAAILDWWRNG